MAAAGQFSVTGTIAGLPFGSSSIGALTVTSQTAVGAVTDVILANGANTITIPSAINVTAALVVFAPTSATVKTLKGVAGDTGIVVTPTGFFLLCFAASAPASFVINSSAADTGLTTYIYFL